MAADLLERSRTSVNARSMLLRRRVATLVCLLLCLPNVRLRASCRSTVPVYGTIVIMTLMTTTNLSVITC